MRDRAEAFVRGDVPPPPVCVALGIRMVRASAGEAEVEYVADGRHANPMGTLHGGVLCDVADAAMGLALASVLDAGDAFTTLEIKANFLRAVREGRLIGRARVVSRGRNVAVLACDLHDEEGRHVATATSTVLLVAPVRPPL